MRERAGKRDSGVQVWWGGERRKKKGNDAPDVGGEDAALHAGRRPGRPPRRCSAGEGTAIRNAPDCEGTRPAGRGARQHQGPGRTHAHTHTQPSLGGLKSASLVCSAPSPARSSFSLLHPAHANMFRLAARRLAPTLTGVAARHMSSAASSATEAATNRSVSCFFFSFFEEHQPPPLRAVACTPGAGACRRPLLPRPRPSCPRRPQVSNWADGHGNWARA